MRGRGARTAAHAAIALLAAMALATGCRRSTTAPRAKAGPGDRAFIDAMVPHHQAGIMLADQAVQRATHPDLRIFAADVRAEEAGEVELMQSWRKAWFDSAATPPPVAPATIPAGPDFDLRWIQAMIAEHEQAVGYANVALRANARGETDSLALHLIAQDTSEIRQLRGFAKQWYGVTLARAPGEAPALADRPPFAAVRRRW